MKYKTFQNSDYEMLKYSSKVVIKDKNENRYYEIDESDFNTNDILWNDYNSIVNEKFFIVYIITFILFLFLNTCFYILYKPTGNVNNLSTTLMIVVYTSFNIILHELSHIISLRMFGRKIDKFGFKFNYIFPSFYVRMNDAHMLSRNEKILVHSTGLYVNMALNLICIFIAYKFKFYNLLVICQLFIFGILMNSVPILNSDGYKTLLSIFMYNEKKEKIYNSKFIKILSAINILIAVIYFLKNISYLIGI
ncbi:hypothetical protein LEQ06_19320 [Paraclostridium sp. AKS46]|nr:hypothetical protein [Paraclostridium sp. AKS46]